MTYTTTQKTRKEKIKDYMIALEKKDYDLVLYYHWETVKKEIKEEIEGIY